MRILRGTYDVETAWPQDPAHARQLTARAVADGFDVVAAMGGDGVAHHVAHMLGGTETALGLIPTGTTNVYARLMGIPAKPVQAARLLTESHEIKSAPLLAVEGTSDGARARHHAIFAGGFGFDADVVRSAESEPYRKYRFGGIHYARTAMSALLRDYRKRQPGAKVTIDGETTEALAVLVQFHTVYTYFGRLPLSIGPTPPGSITVLTVESLPGRRLPKIGATLLRGGSLDKIKGFRVWSGVVELRIEATPPITGQADGELTGMWVEARVWLDQDRLRVIRPPRP